MKLQSENKYKVWAEIDLSNLEYNFRKIKEMTGDIGFIGVVKADAYGHGAVEISKKLEELGADYLAVANIDEAIILRRNGISCPILIFGYTPSWRIQEVLENNLAISIHGYFHAEKILSKIPDRQKVSAHIKIDTGMNRFGLKCGDISEFIDEISKICNLEKLEIEGIYSHFAMSDEESDFAKKFTDDQIELFENIISKIDSNILNKIKLIHLANSGGIANYQESYFNAVRSGILLYGQGEIAEKLGFKSVMKLKTIVEAIKEVKAGEFVGYGGGFKAEKSGKITILPYGYADGFFRNLSNIAKVKIKGKDFPVVGKICMDCCMVWVGDGEVSLGDEVEIFGENISLSELSFQAQTIPYEFLCNVGGRVKRVYLENS